MNDNHKDGDMKKGRLQQHLAMLMMRFCQGC